MNNNKILVIDVSNLLYRMYYVHKYLSNKKGQKTGAIYGFLNMLLFYAKKTDINNMILCWDSPSESNWRIPIYSDYKIRRRIGSNGNKQELLNLISRNERILRKTKKEDIKELLEKLKTMSDIIFAKENIWNITNNLGFINVYKEQYEADDLISMIVKKFRKNIKIISCDKDLLQLIDDKRKVRVYKPMMGHGKGLNNSYDIYNEKKVKEEFGVYPKDFHNLLAITGDDTDDIPGIKGFAYKKASKIYNENSNDLKKAFTKEQYDIYERNLVLVGLHSLPGELKIDDIFINEKRNINKAQKILDDLEIKKFKAKDLFKIIDKEFIEIVKNKF